MTDYMYIYKPKNGKVYLDQIWETKYGRPKVSKIPYKSNSHMCTCNFKLLYLMHQRVMPPLDIRN